MGSQGFIPEIVSSPLITRLIGPVRVLNTSIVVCYENLGTR